ncbi:hypothetical protein RFI_05452, partial [Reticulomyxa filosa]
DERKEQEQQEPVQQEQGQQEQSQQQLSQQQSIQQEPKEEKRSQEVTDEEKKVQQQDEKKRQDDEELRIIEQIFEENKNIYGITEEERIKCRRLMIEAHQQDIEDQRMILEMYMDCWALINMKRR